MPQHLPPPTDPDEPGPEHPQPADPAGPDAEPEPAAPDPPTAEPEQDARAGRVRFDPTRRDSPLRRALRAAGLAAPFGPGTTARHRPDKENPTP